MIKALLIDFARTLIFSVDENYAGGINDLYDKVKDDPDFKFFEYYKLNTKFLVYLDSIKGKIPLYMFTSEFIQDDPAIKGKIYGIFKKIYSAKEIGMSKKDPDAYKFIAKDLNLSPDEVLFIDDSMENIAAAQKAGMNVIQYKDNNIVGEISEVLKEN